MSHIFDAFSIFLVAIVFVALSVRFYVAFGWRKVDGVDKRHGGQIAKAKEVRLTSAYENLNFDGDASYFDEVIERTPASIVSLVVESKVTKPAVVSSSDFQINIPATSSVLLEVK